MNAPLPPGALLGSQTLPSPLPATSADAAPSEDAFAAPPAPDISLDDKYTLEKGRVFLTGTQALVRLMMLQQQRDQLAGLNTAGFVSGYRGSPLGSVDQALWKAKKHLERHQIHFNPGLNEDLAATSVWGTQQVNLYPGAKVDGVFSMWYGKGPGVDRCGDVFKHANAAGTSKHGGVLVIAGDDHAAKSSTLPHQSDHILKACLIPVMFPSTVQEYLDLGLHGYAMSRYAGVWVGMKAVTDVVEASASVIVDPERVKITLPTDVQLPPDGLNIRWPDTPLAQEARLLDYKIYAALAYIRANKLNYTVIDSPRPRLGIISGGKAYLDTRQALDDLGLDEQTCARIGIRLYKVGVVWPLEAEGVRHFAEGLEEILVVEEKRQVIEYQLKEELYNWREDVRPRIFGKFDEKNGGEWAVPQGNWLLPQHYELNPAQIARAITSRLERFDIPEDVRARMRARLTVIDAKERALKEAPTHLPARLPYFCSGCPHNTSTRVPEGSRAMAGIGCHYMTIWMDRRTETFTQMGGEGVPWIGQAPFTETNHVFTNLGDGTYFHSGYLAVRASIAAGVNITYKILYNDAVAMTGGQHVDGQLTVPQLTHQVHAEGARQIVLVSDEPAKYDSIRDQLAPGVTVRHRDELDQVQKELREVKGTTILIYEQTCATEKRRRRKRGTYPDPAKRAFINDAVCEGCGDCSEQSNCLSIEPQETAFGRKRRVNQSTCNKDFSCVKGFCPSFVTVHGGTLKKPAAVAVGAAMQSAVKGGADERAAAAFVDLPAVELPALNKPYGIVITGVGGTGVVTIGALLGMAAHLEGLGVTTLDMAGLAQKGGAVLSHVQIAPTSEHLFATRIATGEADLLLGCDLIVSAGTEALSKAQLGRTKAVVNTTVSPTAAFVKDGQWQAPEAELLKEVQLACGDDAVDTVQAQTLAVALLGDSLYANPFMLGYAWQKGWIPLQRASLEQAIRLNGVAVDKNLTAFLWGRRAAVDLQAVKRIASPAQIVAMPQRRSDATLLGRAGAAAMDPALLDALITHRAQALTDYQDAAYAERYRQLVQRVRDQETVLVQDVEQLGSAGKARRGLRLTETVARNLYKLMAYKDEYEVARLYSDPAFTAKLNEQFEGDFTLEFHLAPPLLARKDAQGHLVKQRYGAWMLTAMRWLAKGKRLRGSWLDPFGKTAERQMERQLIADYEAMIARLLMDMPKQLTTERDQKRLDAAVEAANFADKVRGFGHVKEASVAKALAHRDQWLAQFDAPETVVAMELRRPVAGDTLPTAARSTGVNANVNANIKADVA